MDARLTAFISKIRESPEYIAASASDAKWAAFMNDIEHALETVSRRSGDDMLEAFDGITRIIGRADLSLKQQLTELAKLFADVRDGGKTVH
jgi:hypothetical protein